MENLSETSQLIIGSLLGLGVFIICRKAGLDPFERETAATFAVVFVFLSNLIMRFTA